MTTAARRLMVIDDNEVDREAVRRLVGSEFEVDEAATAREGVRLAVERRPDCVLLDYHLPDGSGVDVVELLGSTETGGFAWRSSHRHGVGAPWLPLPTVTVEQGPEGLLQLTSPYAGGKDGTHGSMDRIEMTPDGRFHHLGRHDGVVKVGGKRIALQHLEEEVLAINGVDDAAAIAIEIEGLRGLEIWLAVVATGHDARSIRKALAKKFDAVVLPRRYRFVSSLPRHENGKLPRNALRSLFE